MRPSNVWLAWCVWFGAASLAYAADGASPPQDIKQQAQAGDAKAQVALGRWFQDDGNPADADTAKSWYRKAADQGSAEGAWMLGSIYMANNGLQRGADADAGLGWMQKSIEIDHNVDHMATLAFAFMIAGRQQDAMTWAQKAADGGSPKGMQLLAMAYMTGHMGVTKDPAQAEHWLLNAAQKGDAQSQAMLGQLYLTNMLGHTDVTAGVQWLQKAAGSGNANAAGTLAVLLLTGKMNVPVDVNRGIVLARQALAANDKTGHYAMGIAYEAGSGVAKDPQQAWYQLAVASRMDSNHQLTGAADYMSKAATHLSPAQLDTLKARVDADTASLPTKAPGQAP